MSRKVYRIGEVANILKVKTSVLRFWESEFPQIRPKRTETGQRYYSEKDMYTLKRIHFLLYQEGMTINGAKKILKNTPAEPSAAAGPLPEAQEETPKNSPEHTESVYKQTLEEVFFELKQIYNILENNK